MAEHVGGAVATPDGASGTSGPPSQPPAIELRDIVKRFPGVVANDGVDLAVAPGTIHAIVGENGAGKSTLMKILYGDAPARRGHASGSTATSSAFKSPRDAIAVGIGMVHQHFMLADNLTVTENIVLGDEPGSPVVARLRRRPRSGSSSSAESYGLAVDPDVLVADARGRRAPAGRDPQGALPGRPHPHPRRAHRRARAAGGRRAVRSRSAS